MGKSSQESGAWVVFFSIIVVVVVVVVVVVIVVVVVVRDAPAHIPTLARSHTHTHMIQFGHASSESQSDKR